MARMTIDNMDLLKLLPRFMQDDETNKALAEAMNVLLTKAAKKVRRLRRWDQIDNMTDSELNELAWEFNVDWWDSSLSLDIKRSIIKTCYRVHEKRGTKWAVEELATSIFGSGKVTEWFEYDGEPYCFKIQTNATLTKDCIISFMSMLKKVKNVRSHFDAIEVTRTIDSIIHAGAANYSFSKSVIIDNFSDIQSNMLYNNAGIIQLSCNKNVIKEDYNG